MSHSDQETASHVIALLVACSQMEQTFEEQQHALREDIECMAEVYQANPGWLPVPQDMPDISDPVRRAHYSSFLHHVTRIPLRIENLRAALDRISVEMQALIEQGTEEIALD